ncbi:MAG: alpha/beta hydrolase [Lysobacterales bacterium]
MPKLIGYMAERQRLRARWVGALERSPVPFCLIDGTADPISGSSLVRRYRELLPQAPLVELPGVGHYPQLEAPEAVVKAVLGFLRE